MPVTLLTCITVPFLWCVALRAAGLHTFADFNQLLELLPRSLAHYLRVSAIVRASAARLGATVYDRMRINAATAVRGAFRPPD